ncbi:hypothetical protein E2562_029121 [Oryza meyeriana var. granulata]|uniref:Uncharacterized protein n=1 Tax=Oryza meyeriana var. granulata TaxID=110450 RepID=A0A6G1EBR5_9ORYZ|nr:hypothetical protein E2562_029121 [Oryza meyeriana var. granulata]
MARLVKLVRALVMAILMLVILLATAPAYCPGGAVAARPLHEEEAAALLIGHDQQHGGRRLVASPDVEESSKSAEHSDDNNLTLLTNIVKWTVTDNVFHPSAMRFRSSVPTLPSTRVLPHRQPSSNRFCTSHHLSSPAPSPCLLNFAIVAGTLAPPSTVISLNRPPSAESLADEKRHHVVTDHLPSSAPPPFSPSSS